MGRTFAVAAAVLACSCASCGSKSLGMLAGYPNAELTDAGEVKTWSAVSAPNMYAFGYTPTLIVSLSGLGDAGDPNCPKTTTTDTTTHVEGGCTDTGGRAWFGAYDEVQDAPDSGTGHITYAQFGYSVTTDCMGQPLPEKLVYDGTFTVNGSGTQTFMLDLVTTSTGADATCAPQTATAAISYSGTNDNGTWNGSGQYGDSLVGKVSGVTKDEVVPGSCSSEAQSGTTTLTSGPSTVVITYDGATKCDSTSTVKWSLNGTDMGELTGVRCEASAGLLAAAAVLALLRRRRSAR